MEALTGISKLALDLKLTLWDSGGPKWGFLKKLKHCTPDLSVALQSFFFFKEEKTPDPVKMCMENDHKWATSTEYQNVKSSKNVRAASRRHNYYKSNSIH